MYWTTAFCESVGATIEAGTSAVERKTRSSASPTCSSSTSADAAESDSQFV